MLPLASSLVDTKALWDVIWVSLVVTVGVTTVFSIGIVGAARFIDLRRVGRTNAATVYAALAVLAAATCVAVAVFGITVMIEK
jgi:cytochrome c biogenesis protein CcdA